MVKVDAGVLSFGATGTIGKTLTFSSWKGRPYVRRRVIPSNPKSGGQVGVRVGMKFGSQIWASQSGGVKDSWNSLAAATNISPFNAFIATGQRRLRDGLAYQQSNPADTAGDPAAVSSEAANAVGRNIVVTWTDSVTAGAWATHIYKGLTTGFTPAPNNLVQIVPAGVEQFIDGPLVADQYFYILIPVNIEGEISTNDVEVDATIS